MKDNRPKRIACCLLLLSAATAAAQPAPPAPPAAAAAKNPAETAQPAAPVAARSPDRAADNGAMLLDQAITRLAGYKTVQARLRQRVDLFGKRMEGSGRFIQGENWQMRLELKISTDDQRSPSSLQQVCDGRYLWDRRDILGAAPQLRKIDVLAVKDAMEQSKAAGQFQQRASMLGLGGVAQLLRGLKDQFNFSDAGEMLVRADRRLVLRGTWKLEILGKMLPDQKKDLDAGKPANLKKLAEHVPDEVLVYLGPEDLFPYRVEFRRTQAEAASPVKPGEPLAGRALVLMELFDVELNKPVDELNFLFKSDSPAVDITDEFLKGEQLKK